jgi:hypothetical protein
VSHPEQPERLTPEEQERFASLPREVAPLPALERSVLDALAEAGQLGGAAGGRFRLPSLLRPSALIPRALAAAAFVLLGVWIGRRESVPATGPTPTFALFLYEGAGFEPETRANYPARYEDYNRWIAPLRAAHQFVDGLQFDTDAVVLDPTTADSSHMVSRSEPLGSMFLIAADDLNGAVGIAESIPHLRYGGRVAVRALVPIEPPAEAGAATGAP